MEDGLRHRADSEPLQDSFSVAAHDDKIEVRGARRDHVGWGARDEFSGRLNASTGRGSLGSMQKYPSLSRQRLGRRQALGASQEEKSRDSAVRILRHAALLDGRRSSRSMLEIGRIGPR